jgi:type I restriction enzyme M protein
LTTNLFKRTPDGEEIIETRQHTECLRIGGDLVERTFVRHEKIEDYDPPVITEKYHEFLKEHDQ